MAKGDFKISHETSEGQRCYIPARYVIAAVLTLGVFVNLLLIVSLPLSMTAMVRRNISGSTNHVEDDTCPGAPVQNVSKNSSTPTVTGDYDWDEVTQNAILTASTYGSLASTLIGGRIVELWNGKYMFVICYVVSSIVYMLLPVTADWSAAAVIAFQVISGLVAGPLQPVMMSLCAAWFPPQERQLLMALVMSTINLGAIVSSVATGNLIASMGWRFVYYLFASLTLGWTILWMYFGYESPNTHPRISEEERIYITENTKKDESQSTARLPWKEILLSPPVWAYVIMGLPSAWQSATLSNALPSYLMNIMHYNTAKIGNISAIPTVASWVSTVFFGFLSQWMLRKKYLSRLTTYHIFNGISTVLPAVFLICIPAAGCNDVVVILLLILVNVCSSAFFGGSMLNQMDLAINYTGTIVGLSVTISSVVSIIAPMITGVLTNNKQTLTAWSTVFYICAGVKIVPFLIYLVIGSADEQPWNRIQEEESDRPNTAKRLDDDPELQQ